MGFLAASCSYNGKKHSRMVAVLFLLINALKVEMAMDSKISIEEAIKNSKSYAKRGSDLAKEAVKLVKKASSNILQKLNVTINDLNTKNVNVSNGVEGLIVQLDEIKNELSILPDKMLDDIKCISKQTINITLFGRTMAGKSTLMEILTHGNGDSIGKGFQRTTRDVRDYSYKGLKITDVPGIAAFEGQEDEEIAYNSAKKADLIFFMITDDAPQASEADCLRKILNLGKPVVCLVNVKANIDEKTSIKMFSRDVSKKMSDDRLEAIKRQFLSFGASFGQTWDMLTFEFVHLKAAYLAQSTKWNKDNKELYRLSRFEYVEKLIADEVIKNGGFYKIKAYIDTVVVPLMTTADILIHQASENYRQSEIINSKKEKLEDWLDKFKNRGKKQIETSLNSLKNDIKREVPGFSEINYSEKDAGKKWEQVESKFRITDRCNDILYQLKEECEEKLSEIYREVAAELKFSSIISSESDIHMNILVDGRKIWNWSVTITSGVLTVLSLFGIPAVGWVALVVVVGGGLLSFLFKSKDEKIKEAREKLEKKIYEKLNKQFEELDKQLKKEFETGLIVNMVNPSFNLFNDIYKTIIDISELQKSFSNSLYDKQEEVNRIIVEEATRYISASSLDDLYGKVIRVSRIPGTCISLCVNTLLSKKLKENLELILKESILEIKHVEDLKELISREIGISKSKVKIEYDNYYKPISIHVDIDDRIDPITINRIKMAQQLSRMYISR